MPTALVIGASRGLGRELVRTLSSRGFEVYATIRSQDITATTLPSGVKTISSVDLAQEDAGTKITRGLGAQKVDLVFVNAGVFKAEVGRPDFGLYMVSFLLYFV